VFPPFIGGGEGGEGEKTFCSDSVLKYLGLFFIFQNGNLTNTSFWSSIIKGAIGAK
jgi:hypothetical protein